MAKLNVYERPDGTWGWRLYGDNNSDIIATDGNQGYQKEEFCWEMADKIVGGDYKDAQRTVTKRLKS